MVSQTYQMLLENLGQSLANWHSSVTAGPPILSLVEYREGVKCAVRDGYGEGGSELDQHGELLYGHVLLVGTLPG